MSSILDPDDPEAWADAALSEYRRSFKITALDGSILVGESALHLFKHLDSKARKTRPKAVMKPEDYAPKITK